MTEVKFFIRPVKDHKASEKEGKEVFADVEYVSISQSGGEQVFNRPATDEDRAKYAAAYKQFLEPEPTIEELKAEIAKLKKGTTV